MDLFATVAVLNPIVITALAIATSVWIVNRPRLRPFRRRLVVGAAAMLAIYFFVDSAFAYRRAAYAAQSPVKPAIHRTVPLPSSLVLVGMSCDSSCLDRLADGSLENVIVVHDPMMYGSKSALHYSVRRSAPNNCPADPAQRAERRWGASTIKSLSAKGICPIIEESSMPSEGVFIVYEGTSAGVGEPAVAFSPKYIVARPPSAVIEFHAIEVQRRSSAGIEVLAETRYYEAPGYLGLPPLLGCWERPDNIVWIMPPGDAGCGLWRRVIEGGNATNATNAAWVYTDVFESPT